MIKTNELELLVANHFGVRTHLIVPNVFWGFGLRHEADLLVATRSKYLYEVELKVSKSDLKAEMKKTHNHIDPKNRIKGLYYAMPKKIYDPDLVPDYAGVLLSEPYESHTNWNGKITHAGYMLSVERKPKINRTVKSISDKEYNKLLELCAMRVWGLKKKLINLTV